jgi:hypothetical protein
MICLVLRCSDVFSCFRPTGHYVRDNYSVLSNMAPIYHIVTVRVIWTSWAHVWSLCLCFLSIGYDSVHDMRRQCAKSNDQWAQGVVSRPNPLSGQHHLEASRGLASQWHFLRGGRGESQTECQWRLNSMAGRPATTWRVINLTKSVTPAWTPTNTPYRWKSKQHTLLVVLHL